MWLPVGALLCGAIVFALLSTLSRETPEKERIPAPVNDGSSVLAFDNVQRAIESGAPPTPWMLRREDREAMTGLQLLFAKAIPNPVPNGRPFIDESLGHGGPQLELRVPILRTHKPIAVLARNWDSVDGVLESNLYFFGSVDQRLEKFLAKLGFEYSSSSTEYTAFRNNQEFVRRRAQSVRPPMPQRDRESA